MINLRPVLIGDPPKHVYRMEICFAKRWRSFNEKVYVNWSSAQSDLLDLKARWILTYLLYGRYCVMNFLSIYSVPLQAKVNIFRWVQVAIHYHYLRHWKRYEWHAAKTEGGGFDTPPMNKLRAIMYVSETGGIILGVDEANKVIFYKAKA